MQIHSNIICCKIVDTAYIVDFHLQCPPMVSEMYSVFLFGLLLNPALHMLFFPFLFFFCLLRTDSLKNISTCSSS